MRAINDLEMSVMLFKKKEVIAASLVVLIGIAGYLNWSYQDTVNVRDNADYVETGKTLGEAEMVSSDKGIAEETEETAEPADSEQTASNETVSESTYFEEAKLNRESARAAATESLKSTASDESIDEETRKLAGEKLVSAASAIELENTIENVAKAKGFSEVCAYINEGTAVITVKTDGLSPEEAVKLTDIVTGSSEISADKVKIIEVKQ